MKSLIFATAIFAAANIVAPTAISAGTSIKDMVGVYQVQFSEVNKKCFVRINEEKRARRINCNNRKVELKLNKYGVPVIVIGGRMYLPAFKK